MRGYDEKQAGVFSYISAEKRVPKDHPLRPIREMADEILKGMSSRFTKIYSKMGRPSIAPEKLLRAMLIQVLYGVPSERRLMEQLDYNLLFRWFVGLSIDDPIWDATTFSKNRDRFLRGEIAEEFLNRVIERANENGLVSEEHFSVDGTLLEAAASLKSFKKKDEKEEAPPEDRGNPEVNFHGEKRSNETHQSRTDPEARLAKKGKGKEAKLSYQGHVLMENRNGLVVGAQATQATGTAEREAGVEFAGRVGGRKRRVTMGADKGYDTATFVRDLRKAKVTPHVTQHTKGRKSAIDGRTTRHAGYGISQKKRARIEEIFGWMKTVGLLRKLRHRGIEKVDWIFKFTAAAYNLVRIRNLVTG